MGVAAVSACNTPRGTGEGGFPGGASTAYEPQPVGDYTGNRADCGVTFRPLLTAYQAVTGSCDANGLDFVQDRSRVSLDYLAQTAEIWSVSVTVSDMADDSVRSERHPRRPGGDGGRHLDDRRRRANAAVLAGPRASGLPPRAVSLDHLPAIADAQLRRDQAMSFGAMR